MSKVKSVDAVVKKNRLLDIVECRDYIKNIGVLRGGISPEHNISLMTGDYILKNIPDDFSVVDILIDKKGRWFSGEKEINLEKLPQDFNLIINSLHGLYGEDGKVQDSLEKLNMAFTGSKKDSCQVTSNKIFTKEIAKRFDIKTPIYEVIGDFRLNGGEISLEDYIYQSARKIFYKIPLPWVIKPVNGGSSVDVHFVKCFAEILEALNILLPKGGEVMVEEYISGKEIYSGVLDNFRGENIYHLIPLEIIKSDKIFDHHSRKNGDYRLAFLNNAQQKEKELIKEIVQKMYLSLGLRHYALFDFILSPKGLYFLEVDALPALSNHSPFVRSLDSLGISGQEFVKHLINLGRN